MAVKLRLSRIGRKHLPYYRIVAIDSRKARDGRPIEIRGNYSPGRPTSVVSTDRADRILDFSGSGSVRQS